jgi:hypothetical protein
VFELPEKDISNVGVQCRYYSTISCCGLCLNNLEKKFKIHFAFSVKTFHQKVNNGCLFIILTKAVAGNFGLFLIFSGGSDCTNRSNHMLVQV